MVKYRNIIVLVILAMVFTSYALPYGVHVARRRPHRPQEVYCYYKSQKCEGNYFVSFLCNCIKSLHFVEDCRLL